VALPLTIDPDRVDDTQVTVGDSPLISLDQIIMDVLLSFGPSLRARCSSTGHGQLIPST